MLPKGYPTNTLSKIRNRCQSTRVQQTPVIRRYSKDMQAKTPMFYDILELQFNLPVFNRRGLFTLWLSSNKKGKCRLLHIDLALLKVVDVNTVTPS